MQQEVINLAKELFVNVISKKWDDEFNSVTEAEYCINIAQEFYDTLACIT